MGPTSVRPVNIHVARAESRDKTARPMAARRLASTKKNRLNIEKHNQTTLTLTLNLSLLPIETHHQTTLTLTLNLNRIPIKNITKPP